MLELYGVTNVIRRLNIDKLLATIAFIFILLALVIISVTPSATGYEISIYDAYPWYFWFFIIIAIACGIVILVNEAFTKKESEWWISGFSAILLSNFVLFSLPSYRGYALLNRGDTMTHIGWMRDIISTGHLPEKLFYPSLHILATSLSYVTSLGLKTIANIFPSFFVVFFIVSTYILSTKLTESRSKSLLIVVFASLLPIMIINIGFSPYNLFFLFLPFFLVLYYMSYKSREKSPAKTSLFILVLVAITFCHPLISLHLIPVLLSLELGPAIYSWAHNQVRAGGKNVLSKPGRASIKPVLIVFITFFAWYSHFWVLTKNIKKINNWLFHQAGIPQIEKYSGLIQEADLSIYEFAELLTKIHGHHVFYLLVSIFLCVIIWKKLFTSPHKIDSEQITFSLLTFVFGLLTIIYFAIVFGGGYPRALWYMVFGSAVLNGLGIYSLGQDRARRIIPVFILILLSFSAVIGVFTLYDSPIINDLNHQVAKSEFQGMEWFFNHRDGELLVESVSLQQIRFADALLGKKAPKENLRLNADTLPDHFGYMDNKKLGDAYTKDRYLLVNQLSRIFYQKVYPDWPHLWRFTREDFNKLTNDPTLAKLYSNGKFVVWRIYAR